MIVAGSLFAASLLLWLHERNIRLLRPLVGFVRRPWFEVAVLLLFVGGMVQYGSTKGFLGTPSMAMLSPMAAVQLPTVANDSDEPTEAIFPAFTNAVTNICATGIKPASTSVFLRVAWPTNAPPPDNALEVYAQHALTSNGWAGVGTASVGAADSSVVVELPYSWLPDGWASSMFFVPGLRTDTDGDGLSDAFERLVAQTDPELADTDGDGMDDGWERQYGFNPLQNADVDGDADNDGVTNLVESQHGSNPNSSDTDGDGLPDGEEILKGTSLTSSDTDGDGLSDKYEVDNGTKPSEPDSDRDGMTDGWEVANGLDPNSGEGDDGASGDPDGDGLTNVDEYQNNCDPLDDDTDGDGVNDGIEVSQDSDPTDASDGGQTPSADVFREIEFNIYGDYAAWEMTIEGLGPDDTRLRKISMGRPSAANTTALKMRKGNSYRLSMDWLNCDGYNDDLSPWYCWQARIDGLPGQSSFDHSYSEGYCVRIPQRNNVVVGNGWIAENEDGLLTPHVHACQRKRGGGSGAGTGGAVDRCSNKADSLLWTI